PLPLKVEVADVFGYGLAFSCRAPPETRVPQAPAGALCVPGAPRLRHQPLQVQLADDAARVSLEAEMHAARHLEALPGRFPQRGRHLEALADPEHAFARFACDVAPADGEQEAIRVQPARGDPERALVLMGYAELAHQREEQRRLFPGLVRRRMH